MKFNLDKQYMKISFHVILTVVVLYIILFAIQKIGAIISFISVASSQVLSLLSPLIFGVIVAYLLDPLVDFYQRKLFAPKMAGKTAGIKKKKEKDHTRRLGATVCTYITIVVFFVVIGLMLSWSVGSHKGLQSMDNAPAAIEQFIHGFTGVIDEVEIRLKDFGLLDQSDGLVEMFLQTVGRFVQRVGTAIVSSITKAGGYVLNFIIILVVTFYLLMDKEKMLKAWKKFLKALLPEPVQNNLRALWKEIDFILSGYIRGQLLDVLIMTVLISITLLIIGIDFAVIIGILSGLANLIPMVGSIVATIIAVLVGLVSDNPMKAVYALICLTILQQIDGNIIVPKVVGESVDLHPIVVILSIVIFGSLFGIGGMIIAVPVTALLKHFLDQWIEYQLQKKESKEKL